MNCNSPLAAAKRASFAVVVLLSTINSQLSALAQGSLTPPDAPAATMKTLQQVEPRTPISSLPFTINSAGSYYLTTNLTGSIGITIAAGNVTLDLNGFMIRGTPSSGVGIFVNTVTNVVIRNGIVTGWTGSGIDAYFSSPRNVVLENLISHGNSAYGFDTREGAVLRNCIASTNGLIGIYASSRALVTDCVVRDNAMIGIFAGDSTKVRDCFVDGNGAAGIATGKDVTITGCQVMRSASNPGIAGGARITVENCSVSGHASHGIQTVGGGLVLNNQVSSNGLSGIVASGSGNRVEGNHTRNNGQYGIEFGVGASIDVVIRNTSISNVLGNFNPASGPGFAPVQNPATMTNAWGNISL